MLGTLPVKRPLVEVLAIDPADLRNDRPESERLGTRVPLALAQILIEFCIGVAATLAWLSYGAGARETIARSFSQLEWLARRTAPARQSAPDTSAPAAPTAPSFDQQQLNAMSLDLGAVRQSIEKITVGQEQMARTVDQLTAGQQQLTRQITELHAIEQYMIYGGSESPPRQASGPAPTPRASHRRGRRAEAQVGPPDPHRAIISSASVEAGSPTWRSTIR
jgi:hypothetical protein